MRATDKKPFEITVWYRFVSNGEIEKDFDTLILIEMSAQEAVNEIANRFKSLRVIPFSFECEGKKYTPTNCNY